MNTNADIKIGRATFAPWNGNDPPSVIDCVGASAQSTVLRHMSLYDLLQLAAQHIADMGGCPELQRELEERAEECTP
jgi:hypothetical protein